MQRVKTTRLLVAILRYVLLATILFAVCFPIIWMVLASFKTQVQIQSPKNLFIFSPTLRNYPTVFKDYNFFKPILNSFIIAAGSTLIGLALGLPASYAISRYRQKTFGMLILVIRFFPGITFLIPWFTIFSRIGLIDTYLALILSHLLINLPFIIWLMVPFFDAMPKELEESARVDGCYTISSFRRITLPLASPGIITGGLLSFVFSWNNFVFSMVLSGGRTKTLPLAVFNFVSYALIDWGALMAASVTITLPVLVIAFVTQRYIIQGLTAGAVKG
ncbi:MAG: carbohydrate ABC transporter permease [Spirochaetes bacterium]|jgi:multiple sugar transport system permease protein|nr:carbohydrate ABC transporter permease [Spirochaetota bacterium]